MSFKSREKHLVVTASCALLLAAFSSSPSANKPSEFALDRARFELTTKAGASPQSSTSGVGGQASPSGAGSQGSESSSGTALSVGAEQAAKVDVPRAPKGIVADDLTALGEVEWKWIARAVEVGEEQTFRELLKDYDKDPKRSPNCHQLSHELGRRAFLRHEGLAAALVFETDWCGGGFSHGVFEAWGRTHDKMPSPEQMTKECTVKGVNPTCGHGVGHALMQEDQDLKKNFAFCGKLGEGLAWNCIDGVMMIFSQSYLAPKPSDPRPDMGFSVAEYCGLVPSKYLHACEWTAGSTWLGVTRNPDRARALRQCLDLKSSIYAPRRCAYGLGETVLDLSGWDADKAVKICAEGPISLVVHCQESALRLLQSLAKEAGETDVCATAASATRELCAKAKAAPYRVRTALDTPLEAWL
jgi:hypothetical protein